VPGVEVQTPIVQVPPLFLQLFFDVYCDFEHTPALWQLFCELLPAILHVPALEQLDCVL
jgi:hypothetical protein